MTYSVCSERGLAGSIDALGAAIPQKDAENTQKRHKEDGACCSDCDDCRSGQSAIITIAVIGVRWGHPLHPDACTDSPGGIVLSDGPKIAPTNPVII